MIRLRNKETTNTTSRTFRGLGFLVLMLCAGFSIYTVGVRVGMKQYSYHSLLLDTQGEGSTTGTIASQGQESRSVPDYLPNVLAIPAGEGKALDANFTQAASLFFC